MSVASVHLNITNKCNLKCSYCYFFEDSVNISKKEPSYSELINYIDQAEEIGAKLIIFSGGEALLHPDIFKILEYGSTPKMLLTNGLLLTEEIIEKLNNIKLLKDVKVSFDGFDGHDKHRGKGTSKLVMEKLSLLDDLGNFPYTINTVITTDNYTELMDIYKVLLQSKCYRWEVDFPVARGRAKNFDFLVQEEELMYKNYLATLVKEYIKDEFPLKINILGILRWEFLSIDKFNSSDFQIYTGDEHPCQYALDSFTVQTSGDVSFCPSLSTVFGNLKNSTLKDILTSDEYLNFSSIKIKDINPCSNCRYLNLCGSGCRADSLAINNNLVSYDPFSCRRMINFEKYILSILPFDISSKLKSLLNEKGYIPNFELGGI